MNVKIAYDDNWQRIHWNSLCSAYRRSPYFEFYEDRFAPFYHKKFDYLFDFNRQMMDLVLDLLALDLNIEFTEKYEKNPPDHVIDGF